VPGVLRNKWFERRHMQHQIYRRSHDHTSELHSAWMNGSGMMIWENVFGSWYPWSPRDRSILRSLLPIQRRYSQLFASEGWTPLVPTLRDNVFASLWTQGGLRLWTLVNRANQPASGTMLQVDARPEQRYFELVAGCELKPDLSGGQAVLETVIPPRGVACFVASGSAQLGNDFEAFLAMQSATFARADFDPACPRRETRLIPVQPVFAQDQSHRGMVVVRARPTERLAIQIRSRECGFYESEPPEGWPQHIYDFQTRTFDRVVQMRPYCIDETPVTNAQYAEFLRATGYYPKHPENFLRHWTGGLPPAGMEEHPVVWVDLDDARSYAKWATKRLPTEEEWQLAAGGNEYPWGNGVRAGCCNLGETGGTTAVKAFPAGRSPWGCYDMCGNVWQWTESERTDGRTRFCMIRGGSYFAAEGSNWYVEGGPRPVSSATKFLLMWPGLDRCATIGFRCAADLKA
jgi:hypothetical protein